MGCSIIRDKETNELLEVRAPNGNASFLFTELLELGLKSEEALKKWGLVYTPAFKNWFGDWEINPTPDMKLDPNGEPAIELDDNNMPLFHATQYTDHNAFKHATDNLGSFLTKNMNPFIQGLNKQYNLTTSAGHPINISYGAQQKADMIMKKHPGIEAHVGEDIGGDYITLTISSMLSGDNILHQVESNQLKAADEAVDDAVRIFLEKLGIQINTVDSIKDKNGNPISSVGKADLLNKTIDIVLGKAGIDTLPEEGAHFLVALLEAQKSPLFDAMMNTIESYQVYDDVVNNPIYQKLYEGDIRRMKIEAIGKLIAKHVVQQVQGKESTASMNRIQRWFDKVVQFLRDIFNQITGNPYARGAYIMLNEAAQERADLEAQINNVQGVFFQAEEEAAIGQSGASHSVNPRERTLALFAEDDNMWETKERNYVELGIKRPWILEPGSSVVERYVGKKGTKYEGMVIKGRVSDEVKKYFEKMKYARKPKTKEEQNRFDHNNNVRKETGTLGHATMEDLMQYHANGSKARGTKDQIRQRSQFNKFQFDQLDREAAKLVAQGRALQKKINQENGTTGDMIIRTEQFVRNGLEDGGTIDVLFMFNDGSAAIYDWKFISPSREAGYVRWEGGKYKIVEDPFAVKMDTYNIQIGAYKKTLLDKYGVTKVRQSRIVPIQVHYKYGVDGKMTGQITQVTAGTGDLGNKFLEQIPVAEEMTDYETINDLIIKLISRKKDVEDRLKNKNFQAGENYEKAKSKKDKIEAQLRKLQVKQDIGYVLSSVRNDLKNLEAKIAEENPLTSTGDPNPLYMSMDELVDLNNDLLFYKSMLAVPDYLAQLGTKEREEIEKVQGIIGPIIMNAQKQIEMKMRERINDKAEERGVTGVNNYNPGIDYMTGNFVTLSKQTNPFMRNLWEIVDELNYNRRKAVKGVAAEIQTLQDEVLEWGKSMGLNGIEVYDRLINDETGNFIPKFQTEFYEARNKAFETGNWRWMKENTYIDEEYFKEKYAYYKKNKLKFLKRKYGNNKTAIAKELKAFERMYDVKNNFATASVSRGGEYFLRTNDSWMSDEYQAIQSIPALKNFHEYYINKVREIEEMFGERLGPGFIANVHKEIVEHMVTGGTKQQMSDSLLENLQLREHDGSLGFRDENTLEVEKKVPKLYIRPITDKNGNVDNNLKSKDLGKGLLLLYNAALDYKLKMDVLPEVKAMEALLVSNSGTIKEIDVDPSGDVIKRLSGAANQLFKTSDTAKLMSGYLDQYFFGNTLDAKDFKIGKLSGLKTIVALKQYHSMMALGLKIPVAAGAFVAGQFSLMQQAAKGRVITWENYRKAQTALLSADPNMRALVEHFDFYQRDDSKNRADKLSAQYATRHMTNDKWFTFLSTADRGLDAVIAYATGLNYGIDPETGRLELLANLPSGTKSIVESMVIKENPKWEGTAGNVMNKALDRYDVTIEGLTEKGEREFRNIARRMSDKVKGTMSDEDKSLYNNTLLMKLMMHYKSWLPGIAMERFGRKRYDHILKTFDEGTWRTAFGNMGLDMTAEEALNTEVHMMNWIGSVGGDVLNIGMDVITFGFFDRVKPKEKLARIKFNEWAANNMDNPEFAAQLKDPKQKEKLYNEFIAMQQGNIRAFLMELRLTLGFILSLMAIGGDYDDDGKIDIRQTWAGRKLYNSINRAYREVAVFTQPQEFFEAGRATGVPMISIGGEVIKWSANTVDEMRDDILGENSNRDRANRFHYTFKLIPGLNALGRAFETSDQYKYSRM